MVQGFGFQGSFALKLKEEKDGEIGSPDKDQNPLFPPGFGGFDGGGGHETCGVDGFGALKERTRLTGHNSEILAPLNLSGVGSPLGLKLKKTPSFLELIEMKLSQSRKFSEVQTAQDFGSQKMKVRCEDFDGQRPAEKLKASNFSASLLRIGSWERVSVHEGDLVAKCYYAKRKLVWEVLDSSLKSKIEIQWSDISGIRATFRENEPGILEIELNHAPLFFKETNPQPRKHTLWQATADFTGGQAAIYRRHYLQFPHGTLEKHYEKLLQCDNHLYSLSQSKFPTMDSPYFSVHGVTQEYYYGLDTDRPQFFLGNDQMIKNGYPSRFPQYGVTKSVGVPSQHIQKFEPPRSVIVPSQKVRKIELPGLPIAANGSASPCSVMDYPPLDASCAKEPVKWKVALSGAKPFKNQENICNRASIVDARQTTPVPQQCSPGLASSNYWALNEIARHLLVDPPGFGSPDELKVLAKVNSMNSLINAAPNMGTAVENIRVKHGEYGREKRVNDSVTSTSSELSDSSGNCPYQHLNSLSWFPQQNSSGNLPGHLPQNSSDPYMFSNQMMNDGASQEHNILWDQWR